VLRITQQSTHLSKFTQLHKLCGTIAETERKEKINLQFNATPLVCPLGNPVDKKSIN